MRKIFVLMMSVLVSGVTYGQATRGKATVTVTGDRNTVLESATLELLRSKDSALVKTALTDKTGIAEFENVAFGEYIARVSAVGYNKEFTAKISLDENNPVATMPALTLMAKAPSELEGVVISTKKTIYT